MKNHIILMVERRDKKLEDNFKNLKDGEKVMTLNNETGEMEWQLPNEWQAFDNNNEMYKIELVDGGKLVGSESSVVSGSTYDERQTTDLVGGSTDDKRQIKSILSNMNNTQNASLFQTTYELIVSKEHRVYASSEIKSQNSCPSDLRYLTSSSVLNTSTNPCSWKCASSGQIGILLNDSERARYSVSSLSEINGLACIKKNLNFSFGTILIFDFNSSNNLLYSSEESLDNSLISLLCSSNSSKRYSGEYNSTRSESKIFFVLFDPSNKEKIIEASTTSFNFIDYFNSGYNLLYLSCNDLLTFLPSLIDSSFISSSSCNSSILVLIDSSFNNLAIANLNFSLDSSGTSTLNNISAMKDVTNNDYKKLSVDDLSKYSLQKIIKGGEK